MDSTSIGLDIGSSAVRAAEISIGREGKTLRRYAQVGLPHGAVTDGEIVDPGAVTEALRRLWTEGGFSSKRVVLGVSGPRVIVRQADVPALDEEDIRSSLRFDAQELIPIPMDTASFDFRVLDHGSGPGPDGKSTMQILIVAAHRDMLRAHLAVLKGAGLQATAIEPMPLALMRVVPPASSTDGPNAVEALVAIGAELTTVAVRQGDVPRFIRSLAVGGQKLTTGLANALHIETAVAERMKRTVDAGESRQISVARKAIGNELRDLAEEIRATVDFFAAQADGSVVERLYITGGASQTQGLVEALAGTSTAVIERIDPFAIVGSPVLDLADDVDRARAGGAAAVGLALWPTEGDGSRVSILPDDVAAAQRARRLTKMAAGGVAILVCALGAAGVLQAHSVGQAKAQVRAADRQVAGLQSEVNQLQGAMVVHGKVLARASLVVTALTGDVDWVRVLAQLAASTPPDLTVDTFSASHTVASSSTSSSGTSASAPGAIGTLTMSVSGSGGLPAVASWLDGLQRDHTLEGTWVSGISVAPSGRTITFSSTTNLTRAALSTRAARVQR